MTKQDQILEHVIKIKTDIGGIKQHLKTINGTMENHDKSIDKLEKKQSWAFGVGAGLVFVISLLTGFWKGILGMFK